MTDTPLPEPAAWMIPGDNCRENGFVDVMAWSEGEFTAPLFTRDQLLSALSAERQAREAAEKETEQLREYVNEDKADADKWRRLACIDGPANSYELWKDRAEAAEKESQTNQLHAEHEHNEGKRLSLMLKEAEARLREAEAVIAPFAEIGAEFYDLTSKIDKHAVWGYNDALLIYGDFRAAAAWIAKGETDVAS